MNKKLRSTLGLVGLLLIIIIAAVTYLYFFQSSDLDEKKAKLNDLQSKALNQEELQVEYDNLLVKSNSIDSILTNRPFNIPKDLSSLKFYTFVNNLSDKYSENFQVNIVFNDKKPEREFFYYTYSLEGFGFFNEAYNLIYAIENSKELKKVESVNLSNLVKTQEDDGVPLYLVNFSIVVRVYFSMDDRFTPATYVENNLSSPQIYDPFYPAIRNEIMPNIDGLLDVQSARLLALIPEGAFIADGSGNTYLMWEGEQVYLGYLTKIDYENNNVTFILNKGGIIENVTLQLNREGIINKENEK